MNSKRKQQLLNGLCVLLALAIAVVTAAGLSHRKEREKLSYQDGIQSIDPDTIYLQSSKVEVQFGEVLLSGQKETRKLIVSEQSGTVTTTITDRLINKMDYDFLKKTQDVTYTGKGYFVVDLDRLEESSIVQDSKNRTVTIFIDHAYLQAIEIDPDKILIADVKQGLLARGNIELTVSDYNAIEKELRFRLEKAFNTAENGQKADTAALEMVKAIYQPLVTAIDSRYTVIVSFR
ncbi:MAG: DUF4230 domain-containing protein [Firmicutes bacterium]|nr:DUF4230 domain-containing protein [Bacillota bacterium]